MPKIYKSVLMCEIFQPLLKCERRMTEVAKRIAYSGEYHMLEMAPLLQEESRRDYKKAIEDNNMSSLVWAAHVLWAENLNALSSLDSQLREKAIKRCIDLIDISIEMGATYLGLPPGDDVGPFLRADGLKALADSVIRLAGVAKKYDLNLLVEPLDRDAHKKGILGPIQDSVEWIRELRKDSDNVFLHWDSAHEALGDMELIESFRLAKDYTASFHLANSVLDKSHPFYGDWHMDVGQAGDFETEGFLTPEVGAALIKEASGFPALENNPYMHVSVEVRSHLGDDMNHKFKTVTDFLNKCFELAGQ